MRNASAHDFWQKLSGSVWNTDVNALSRWRAGLLRWIRLLYLVGRDLTDGQLNLRAMSLVYTTLLSLVPLLAVSFSVLKAFGVHNQIEPMMLNFMTPLGDRGVEITSNVIGFVDKIRVGVLGAVGLGLLIYTVISLIQKIEGAFNYTWHVAHGRSFGQRFRDYLSVILIGPVLVFSALGATASLMSHSMVQALVKLPVLAWVVETIGALVPYLFVIAAFTFVYMFVPNTRVRLGSAVVGALVAGFLWQSAGWGFASFVVASAKYAAIYSGFAILVLFMLWLYLAWLILLVGASIAFYHQHPEYLTMRRRELSLSNRMKERLALLSMYLIADSHFRGAGQWTLEALARHLAVPTNLLGGILAPLEAGGLLTRTGETPPVYVPARAPERISLIALLETVRRGGEEDDLSPGQLHREQAVNRVIDSLDRAVEAALRGITLRELCLGAPLQDSLPPEPHQAPSPAIDRREKVPGTLGGG